MNIIKPTITFRKRHLYISGVLLIIILSSFGGVGYKYIKKQEKALKTQITDLNKDIDSLNIIVLDSENYIEEILNTKEDEFEEKYYRERKKRIKAEKELSNIKYINFRIKYLDSLSDHVIYR